MWSKQIKVLSFRNDKKIKKIAPYEIVRNRFFIESVKTNNHEQV